MERTERSPCGSGGCMICPFSCNEESEMVQNYGCLPERVDIIRMKEESGHNWSCHYDENKLCGGFARYINEERSDLDIHEGNLISYDTWYRAGEEAAIKRAGGEDLMSELEKAVEELKAEGLTSEQIRTSLDHLIELTNQQKTFSGNLDELLNEEE